MQVIDSQSYMFYGDQNIVPVYIDVARNEINVSATYRKVLAFQRSHYTYCVKVHGFYWKTESATPRSKFP
jgi:hypothetical protein